VTEFSPEPQQPMAYPHREAVANGGQPQAPAAGAWPAPEAPSQVAPGPVAAQSAPYATQPGAPVGFEVEQTGVAGSWLLATAAALMVGAVSAFLYAAISFAIHIEILMLVIVIGFLVGMTVAIVAKRTGFITGLVAAAVTAGSVLLADVLMVVFYAAGSIPSGLSRLADIKLGAVISAYFSDPLGYLWIAVAVFFAFKTASGMGSKKNS
jgi:hypothetical protein